MYEKLRGAIYKITLTCTSARTKEEKEGHVKRDQSLSKGPRLSRCSWARQERMDFAMAARGQRYIPRMAINRKGPHFRAVGRYSGL